MELRLGLVLNFWQTYPNNFEIAGEYQVFVASAKI